MGEGKNKYQSTSWGRFFFLLKCSMKQYLKITPSLSCPLPEGGALQLSWSPITGAVFLGTGQMIDGFCLQPTTEPLWDDQPLPTSKGVFSLFLPSSPWMKSGAHTYKTYFFKRHFPNLPIEKQCQKEQVNSIFK